MKIVAKEVIKQEEFFIAKDGREFCDERMCHEHEELLSALETIETCDELDGKAPFGFSFPFRPESDYKWYKPKTAKEIGILNKYYRTNIFPWETSQWICVEKTNTISDTANSLNTTDSLDDIKKFLNILGFNTVVQDISVQN